MGNQRIHDEFAEEAVYVRYRKKDEGNAISGGFVYTETALPLLKGKYLFGNSVNGRVFLVDSNDLKPGIQDWRWRVKPGKSQNEAVSLVYDESNPTLLRPLANNPATNGSITHVQPTDKGAAGVPADNHRYENLKRGINIDNWLVRNEDGILAPTQYTEADLRLIKRAGFRHVRFPIRSVLMNEQQPDKLARRDIDSIRAVLNLMLKNELAVVFNPVHPAREYTARMETDTAMQSAFIRFWTALATEFRSYDPERVFIEPMNEPFFKSQAVWDAFNGRLLAAIRQAAPNHTLIVTPVKGNQDVADMQPVDDRNVVYSTHCYSPFAFTHQGAPWLKYKLPTGQRYPSQQWTINFIHKDFFDRVLGWAKTHQVRLYLGEYGVLNTADYADRLAWLTDMSTIIRENELAAALWCYSPGFSILEDAKAPSDQRKFDEKFLKALNVKQ